MVQFFSRPFAPPSRANYFFKVPFFQGFIFMLKTIFIFFVLITFSLVSSYGQGKLQTNKDPEKTRFVTSDIKNFWNAYDLAKKETDFKRKVEIFQKEYIEKGSPGLKGFMPHRIISAEKMVQTINKAPKFYASIRKTSQKTSKMKNSVIKSFKELKKIYPDAIFPNVYFVIGRMNSGGTISNTGILIGTEMHCLSKNTPKEELSNWLKSVLAPIDNLPHIIAHESIHYQQRFKQNTLLEKAIQEGGADFIAELISGKHINHNQHDFGNKNEIALWKEFKTSMNGKDYSKWLYDGGKTKGRPADMGYYMGYKICESYYKNAENKKQAIKDMLLLKDANEFLEKSKYPNKFKKLENQP